MTAENKAIARRVYEEIWNARKLSVADEIVAPDCTLEDPATPGLPRGPEGLRQLVQLYGGAFPDLRFTIIAQVAEGDLVATRFESTGTHEGDLAGIAPTHRRITVSGMTLDRIVAGKIRSTRANWDALGLMQQIGAVPLTFAPPARGAAT